MTLFWFLWWLTACVAGWQILRVWVYPREVVGFATIVSLMWLYFYAWLPYQAVHNFMDAFPTRIWTLGQLIALLALLAFLAGWYWRLLSRRRTVPKPVPDFNYDRLWWAGIALIFIGKVSYNIFLASGREFDDTSAYWYMLLTVVYPGMAVCTVVLIASPQHRTIWRFVTLAVLVAVVVWPSLRGARRGPVFVTIISITMTYFIVRQRPPRPGVVLGVFVATGLLILTIYTGRRSVYSEGTWSEFFETVTVDEVVTERAARTSDNEFFNHCLALEANLRTGLYQYGTTHLAMLVHWVPRSYWPGKPSRGRGFFPTALYAVETEYAHNVGYGGAIACVEDTFDNYGYFFPIFWFIVGYGSASFFARSQDSGDLRWKMHYVGLLASSHWFIAQNLPEALVPFCFFQASYFAAFYLARVNPAKSPAPTRRGPRPALNSA